MERIEGHMGDQSNFGKESLAWITCANRPLKPNKLQCALGVELGTTELDPDNLPDLEDILSVCARLVTIDNVRIVIRLVHYTTQDFFEKTLATWFPDTQGDIANIRVTYLSYSAFGATASDPQNIVYENRKKSCILYEYAACN